MTLSKRLCFLAFFIVCFVDHNVIAHIDEGNAVDYTDDMAGEGRQDAEIGMEIDPEEFHNRRELEEETAIITTTKKTTVSPIRRPYPPLNRRFRRIFNADETAKIEDYPFIAALLMNNQLWCAAAIVSRDKILTAAHCLQLQYNNRFFREYMKMLTVRVGSSNTSSGGELLAVSEIFFHPNYKPETLEFNLAVVTLHKNLSFDKFDVPVDSIAYATTDLVSNDKTVSFLGWGSVLGESGVGGDVLLQKVDLPVYDQADCQDIYGKDLVTKNNFCAGYITQRKNVCNHDAGGPAIMDGQLVGILSFSNKRCDELDKPAVFVNVGTLASWVNSVGRAPENLIR